MVINDEGRIEANMHDAKTNLSRLISEALDGKEVVICRHGKPVARLTPFESVGDLDRLMGCMKERIETREGWDAPLEGEELNDFYRGGLG